MFKRLSISLDGYEGWFNRHQMDVEPGHNQATIKFGATIRLLYRMPDKVVRLSNSVVKQPGFDSRKVTYKQSASVDYIFRHNVSADDIIDYYRSIQDLTIIISNFEKSLPWPKARTIGGFNDITIYFYRQFNRGRIEDSYVDYWTLLPQVSDSLARLFTAWEHNRRRMGAGFYTYLATRRGAKLYVETRFTTLITGLESFHRKLTNIDPQRAPKRSLQVRLSSLFKVLPIGLEEAELNKFAQRCAVLRNALSHTGEPNDSSEPRTRLVEIDILSDAIDILYHFRILLEIGVDRSLLADLLQSGFVGHRLKMALGRAGFVSLDPPAVSPKI